jgi:hypothetical protein
VRIFSQDNDTLITGKLDLLVFTPDFWIMVVETKGLKYSIEVGIPQLLAYMLGTPHPEKLALGMVTNGTTFRFLKLTPQSPPQYAQSDLFSLDSRNDLYVVLKILKRIAQLGVE